MFRVNVIYVSLAMAVAGVSLAQESKPSAPSGPPPAVKNTSPPPPPLISSAAAEPSRSYRTLTYAQRRELGMTFGNFGVAEKDLRQNGRIDELTSDSEAAVLILAELRRKNPRPFNVGGYDWEACLGFIETWYVEFTSPAPDDK